MPSGGPVISYPVTQGAGGQSQNYPQIFPQAPGNGWTPQEIVQGFLTASAAFGDHRQLAKQYLTTDAHKGWNPTAWGAIVYSSGPFVLTPRTTKKDKHGEAIQVAVAINGNVQANLTSHGSYVVPAASGPAGPSGLPQVFTLDKVAGQWRISQLPPGGQLLLNSVLFQDDYQLRNLYFYDPSVRVLVPHPVYVPLQATPATLLDGLVADLITAPNDWLSQGGATKTAFPAGAKSLGDVTLDGGTATVDLGGAISKASNQVLSQVSAQLFWTLTGAGQGGPTVQSIQLNVNGKPWTPPGAQDPVQRQSSYSPATGKTQQFYYIDHAGYLVSRAGVSAKPVRVGKIGPGVTQLAVSPGGQFVAVLKGGTLYTGPVGGKLIKQADTGYGTMSWDPAGNLWTTRDDQIFTLPDGGQSHQQPIAVTVWNADGTPNSGPFSTLRVAPDGVRVAIVVGGTSLNFGAIAWQAGTQPGRTQIRIQLSPFYVAGSTLFNSVAWYGADNVVTLGDVGVGLPPVVTEYPVSGGQPTSIQGETGMTSLTASDGNALIASLRHGGLVTGGTLTGAWTQLTDGTAPVTGTVPAYPG